MTRFSAGLRVLVTTAALTACTTSTTPAGPAGQAPPLVVATSAIAADFIDRIAGDAVELITIVPNAVDTHTYEPKASELRALDRAALVVLPDSDLNPEITQVARLTVGADKILDLNAASLSADEYVYREPQSRSGRNVHTWTDPVLAAKWVAPLATALAAVAPEATTAIQAAARLLTDELAAFDAEVVAATRTLPADVRKLVVYHDAWEYFGRRYDYRVVGALQAVNFAEPSAAEIARMAGEIRNEGVPAFFGSEVFPSDVMEALEAESGARYVPDLADDALPGESGDDEHTYIGMMRRNLAIIVESLRP